METAQTLIDHWLAIVGVIAGVVSIILGVGAVALSVYFFVQAKNVETETSQALAGIRGQTETLTTLANQQLKGLTTIVREQFRVPERGGDSVEVLVTVLEKLTTSRGPGLIEQHSTGRAAEGESIANHSIPFLAQRVDEGALKEFAAICYHCLYYYASYANLFAQQHLPTEVQYEESNAFHRLVRELLDQSANDFLAVAKGLDGWIANDPFPRAHRLHGTYGAEGQKIKEFVRTAR